jgi:hypothetical protein
MTGSMFGWINLAATASPSSGPTSPSDQADESFTDYLLRVKDELFWPRIPVRSAPPPDGI